MKIQSAQTRFFFCLWNWKEIMFLSKHKNVKLSSLLTIIHNCKFIMLILVFEVLLSGMILQEIDSQWFDAIN